MIKNPALRRQLENEIKAKMDAKQETDKKDKATFKVKDQEKS